MWRSTPARSSSTPTASSARAKGFATILSVRHDDTRRAQRDHHRRNQGLGLEIARAFVRNGANVVLCARETDRLGNATAELRAIASHRTIIAEGCDVSRED